jgi:nucleoside-diphosphate-sugar epimerase
MKVLVTGGSGFIGRHIVEELLEHGYEVKILTRKRLLNIKGAEIARGDITQFDTLLPAMDDIDAVFHNAAYAADWGKREEIYNVNVKGTMNVARACMENGIDKMVFTSSAGVYGFPNTMEEIIEGSPKKPMNAYQQSKLDAEKALRNLEGMRISIIRPPLVLGAGGKASQIILERIEKGEMTYIGSGDTLLSVAHPKDVARCLRLSLEKDMKGSTYNVVSFISPVRDIFEEIAHKLGVKPPEKHVSYAIAYAVAFFSEMFSRKEPSLTRFRVKSFGTSRRISCEKAKKELGYEPEFDLKRTVEDMISWHASQ